jgi:hypothetical protein
MTWLYLFGGWLRKAATALFGLIARWPWQTALIASLCLSLWFLHGRQDARHELAEVIAAQKAAAGAQKRVNDAAQAHYERKANEADTRHDALVADVRTDTDRFIANRRVRPQDRTCQAPASPSSDDPGVHDEVSANPVVAVSEPDVRACADAAAYAVSAYQWAQSLKGE